MCIRDRSKYAVDLARFVGDRDDLGAAGNETVPEPVRAVFQRLPHRRGHSLDKDIAHFFPVDGLDGGIVHQFLKIIVICLIHDRSAGTSALDGKFVGGYVIIIYLGAGVFDKDAVALILPAPFVDEQLQVFVFARQRCV